MSSPSWKTVVPMLSVCFGTARAGDADWPYDAVRLSNGSTVRGLIVEEDPGGMEFLMVRRKPGRATVTWPTTIVRAEIEQVDRLGPEDRKFLTEQLQALKDHTRFIKERPDAIELTPTEWSGKPGAALAYDSDHFRLVSTASEPIVRRAAVRLEQIYVAYARYLPPRHPGGKPTTIILLGSEEEYMTLLRDAGHTFANPAFYEPEANRIVCGSNLKELGRDVTRYRKRHEELVADLNEQVSELRRLYGRNSRDLQRHLEPIQEMWRGIWEAEKYNMALIDETTNRLFALLYHESFHAYLRNFVYLGGDSGELPRWLEEGLAQVFETAIVEGGELRIGHADEGRLKRARQLLRDDELVPLRELLRCRPGMFRVDHLSDRRRADRAYLTAWALASYLTFEKRSLGGAAMGRYARGEYGDESVAAFERFVGTDVERVEAGFRDYLGRLQSNGSLANFSIKKD